MKNFSKNYLIYIFIFVLNIIIISFFFYQIRSETESYLSLRSENGFTFLVPLAHSIEHSINAENKMVNIYSKYMEAVANDIAESLQEVKNYRKSEKLIKKHNLFKLVFLDKSGNLLYSSRGDFGNLKNDYILKVCKGELSSYSIGLKKSKYGDFTRFAYIKHIKGGAFLIIQEGENLKNDFKELGYKHVFNEVTKYSDILFILFQTFEGVDYVSDKSVLKEDFFTKIDDDYELNQSVFSDEPITRLIKLRNKNILECIYPIYIENKFRGVIRAGLSLEFVNILKKNSTKNIFLSILLVIILDIFFLYSMLLNKKRSKEGFTFISVLESLNDGVVIFDFNKIVLKNKKADEFLENNPDFLLEFCKLPYEKIEKNGKTLLVLRNEYKNRLIYIIRDVSIENLKEETKERESKMLSMGRLSSVFAHEIRNPLNSISMILQQLEMIENISKEDKDMIKIVKKELIRLDKIVKDFMEVVKMPEIKKVSTNINQLFNEIKLLYKGRTNSGKLKLSFNVEKNIEEIFVDVEKFKGVLINLIENSIGANSTEIQVNGTKEDSFVKIDILDNGDGMDEITKSKIFDLYFTTKETGSGLGLPYVQRIITAHGGLISIESEKNKGTEVKILLKPKLEEA